MAAKHFCIVLAFASVLAAGARANVLVNGDFEANPRLLVGWTSFQVDGDGSPEPAPFDVTGNGSSLAASWQAGQPRFPTPGVPGGAGIEQVFNLASGGSLSLSVDFAAQNDAGNGDAGTFSLLLDGVTVQSDALGAILAGQTLRGTLGGIMDVSAGQHTIALKATRLGRDDFGTPTEYFDNANAQLVQHAISEPATLSVFGAVFAGTFVARRRKKS